MNSCWIADDGTAIQIHKRNVFFETSQGYSEGILFTFEHLKFETIEDAFEYFQVACGSPPNSNIS